MEEEERCLSMGVNPGVRGQGLASLDRYGRLTLAIPAWTDVGDMKTQCQSQKELPKIR